MPDNIKKTGQAVIRYDHNNVDEYGYVIGVPTGQYSYELCYWRKCWNLRDDIVEYLNSAHPQNDPEPYNWLINIDDINPIVSIISSWNNQEKWDNEGRSIWNYEDMKPHLNNHISNLEWLKEYLSKNPNAICYFYDSY